MMMRKKIYLLMWLVAAAVVLSTGDPVDDDYELWFGYEMFNFTYNAVPYDPDNDTDAFMWSSSSAVNHNLFLMVYVLFILCML